MNKQNILIQIAFSLIIFVIEYLFAVNNTPYTTRFFEFQLVIVWGYTQYSSYKKFGVFNLFTLLLSTTFIFAVGGVFHFAVSGDDITILDNRGFGNYVFPNSIIQKSLLLYTIYIAISYLSYSLIYDTRIYYLQQENKYKRFDFKRLGKILMYLFLWAVIYKGYLYVNSFSVSRVLIYLYGNMENPVPTWVRFFATFFEIGYFFIIASKPNKSVFKKYSILYFATIIPEVILGNRGMLGAFILFYLWYYSRNYKEKAFKTKYIVVGGVFMLFVFQFMELYRNSFSAGELSFSLTSFLVGQSISFYILPLYMLNAGAIQYYSYPFVLYTLLGGFSGYTGQSIEVLKHKCGVGHQLMYAVNPNYYLSGGSFGSSSITELYDLGIWGVIVGAVLVPCMIKFIDRKITTSPFFRFASFLIFSDLMLSPRGSVLPGAYGLLKLFIFYTSCLTLYSMFIKRR